MRVTMTDGELTPAERGLALARMRRAAGLTQRQVALHFGVDKSAVSAWEQARSSPTGAKLMQLDELYSAGGSLLAMYGFSLVDVDETLSDRVARLEAQNAEMVVQIAALMAFVDFPPATSMDDPEDDPEP